MPSWKKIITSGSNATLNSLYAPSITGSLLGTASYALYAATASYATNIFISGSISDVDYINFQTGSDQPQAVGRLGWDDGYGTLNLGLKGSNINLAVGQENVVLAFNGEATSLVKGEVVYVSGSQGNRPAVKRAIATSDGYSATTLGIVAETITAGAEGFISTFGMINDLNTLGTTGGAPVWLSPTVSGAWTTTKPTAPGHTLLLGYIVRVHASVGSIFVHISNGWELGELHDVLDTTTTSSYGDLLVKSGSLWINSKQLTGSYAITGSLTATSFTGSLLGTASYATQALSASYAPDTTFPYTGSAIISGSLTVTGSLYITGSATLINKGSTVLSGSFKVRGEGNGFVGPFMAIEVDDANGSRKLFDADQGSSSIDFGNRALLASDSSAVLSWSNVNGTYTANKYTSHYIEPTVKADLVAYQGTGGQILSEVTFDVSVVDFDLVYLDTTNVWKQVDQTTTSTVKLLGICVGVNPGNQIGDVFIEGDIVVTTNTGYPIVESADYGIPVYIKESSLATMSTVEPTTGTVRKLGFCYYNNGGTEWIMKFRPNN